MNPEPEPTRQFCQVCHVGSLHPHHATYARWHDGQFIIIPNVPAWQCDVCGDTFYDPQALTRLTLLLGPESDTNDQRRWRGLGLDDSPPPGLGDRRRA